MYRFFFAIFLLSSSFLTGADNVVMPVMIGGDNNLDACPSLGVVFNLNPNGDGFLAVRSGANTSYPLIDKLPEGQHVNICNSSIDGNWLGVVYSNSDVNDCGLSRPVSPVQPYKGKCKSGWVNSRWINVIAG